jgi:hypothetical protein
MLSTVLEPLLDLETHCSKPRNEESKQLTGVADLQYESLKIKFLKH